MTFSRTSDHYVATEKTSRLSQAMKIDSVLTKRGIDVNKKKILEVGCGAGYISQYFSRYSPKVYGVDVADERVTKSNYKFQRFDGKHLPFKDGTFDLIISNHVIEHVGVTQSDQQRHLDEIYRVLKVGGVLYLATPNVLWLYEPHLKTPFIHWLPFSLRDQLVRFREQSYQIRLLSKKELELFVQKARFSNCQQVTTDVMEFRLSSFSLWFPISKIPNFFSITHLDALLPSINILAQK